MRQNITLKKQKDSRLNNAHTAVTLNDCQKVLFQQRVMSLNECIEYLQQLKDKKTKA